METTESMMELYGSALQFSDSNSKLLWGGQLSHSSQLYSGFLQIEPSLFTVEKKYFLDQSAIPSKHFKLKQSIMSHLDNFLYSCFEEEINHQTASFSLFDISTESFMLLSYDASSLSGLSHCSGIDFLHG